MKSEQRLLRQAASWPSESDEEEQQSPYWSLASFGFQHRRAQAAAGRSESADEWQAAAPSKQHQQQQASEGSWFSPGRCSGAGGWWRCLLAVLLLALLVLGSTHLASKRRQQAAVPGAATQQPQQCRLQLRGSVWDQHCQRLERVCVDQGMLVLYDERYQQLGGRKAGGLPELLVDTSKIYEYPWRGSNSSSEESAAQEDSAEGERRRRLAYQVQSPSRTRRIPPLPMRPATSEEPTAYLQHPEFSSCTVPLFLYASWRGNFFHVFKDLSAVVYAMLRRTPWRDHAKLVSVTPEGLPLTKPEAALLPMLSPLSVQSMADFSSRLPPGYRPELDAAQPPASFEGGQRRCFQTAFFCGRNFPLGQGQPAAAEEAASQAQQAAALAKLVPVEPFSFGQAVALYKQQQQRRQQGGKLPPDAITMQAAAAAAAGAPPLATVLPATPRAHTSGRLRIAFMKRGSEGRQILNVQELLRRCNSWRYVPPGGGAAVTAECTEVSLPDLESGVAAAREADVFIGMHGANLANGWLMRPGSSVVELIPYQFDKGRGAMVFSTTNAKDATSQVLWWVGVLCDPSASTPGPEERAGTGLSEWWPRDRSSRVPWAVLESALKEVVTAGGSHERYMKDYYAQGKHRLYFDGAGVVARGGSTCPS